MRRKMRKRTDGRMSIIYALFSLSLLTFFSYII